MSFTFKTLNHLSKININVEWLWLDLILRKHVTILASRGGAGKSSLALWIANDIANKKLRTLYIDEERTGGTHGERARKWKLKNLDSILFYCEETEEICEPAPLRGVNNLIKAVMDNNIDLLIIDSMSFAAKHLNTEKRNEAITYIDELKTIANKTNCGLLILCHLNKQQDPEEILTLDSIYGSGGITDAARSVIGIDFKPAKDKIKRTLKHLKSNYSALAEDREFDLTENGIENLRTKKDFVNPSGIMAQHLRSVIEELLNLNYTKKQIQEYLRNNVPESTPNQRSRALREIENKLNVKWS